MSSPVQPNEMDNQPPIRGSNVHAQQADSQSKGNFIEDISRLQSAVHQYSNTLTYKIDDLVIESGLLYRNITPVTSGESFDILKWVTVSSPIIEIGRATVSGVNASLVDIVLTRITKFMKVYFYIANNSPTTIEYTYNNDFNNPIGQYSEVTSIDYAPATNTTVGKDSLSLIPGSGGTGDFSGEIFITNVSGKIKVGMLTCIIHTDGDVMNQPTHYATGTKWIKPELLITSIQIFTAALMPNINIGSEFVVMGWD